MAFETLNWDGEFARFWRSEFNSMQCPPTPATPDELQLAQQLALRNFEDGKLFQNLFAGKKGVERLPADTSERLASNTLLPRDAEPLRRAGYEHAAQNCDKYAAHLDDLRLQQESEVSRKEYIEAQKRNAQWSSMSLGERMASTPVVSARAAEQARREWGISEVPN